MAAGPCPNNYREGCAGLRTQAKENYESAIARWKEDMDTGEALVRDLKALLKVKVEMPSRDQERSRS